MALRPLGLDQAAQASATAEAALETANSALAKPTQHRHALSVAGSETYAGEYADETILRVTSSSDDAYLYVRIIGADELGKKLRIRAMGVRGVRVNAFTPGPEEEAVQRHFNGNPANNLIIIAAGGYVDLQLDSATDFEVTGESYTLTTDA